ncbi:MAG: DUF1932 domain-containing protein [Pseudomonadota bacterium]
MKIAFLGFGEAARAFVQNWTDGAKAQTCGFDVKSGDPSHGMTKIYADYQILEQSTAADAVADADVIFSLVTADQAIVAARSAQGLKKGAMFLDCNSVSPGTKTENAKTIEDAGGLYTDVAVMAPVYPALNTVPLLLSGPHARAASDILKALTMNPTVVEGEVGYASSIKMIRSIMVKGMEALSAECALAAVAAGIDDRVLASLSKSFPGMNWADQIAYNLERMSVHGPRRAAEMAESAKTIAELGLPNTVTQGTVAWQDRIGRLGYRPTSENYKNIAQDILALLKK